MSKTVCVKYCGGCNPRYDRVAFVNGLKPLFPENVFLPAQPGQSCDALLVICGCSAACASYTGIPAQKTLVLDGPAEDAASEFLKSIS